MDAPAARSRRAPRILTGADGRFVFRDLGDGSFSVTAAKAGYRLVATADLEQSEWFDADVLGPLVAVSSQLIVSGTEKQTVDLPIRQHP